MSEDTQPRYTTKRLHDEIAKAREQGRQDALAEIARASSNPTPGSNVGGWQPITTAPKDGSDILLLSQDEGMMQVAYYECKHTADGYKEGWELNDARILYHPEAFAYWMPLPSASVAPKGSPISQVVGSEPFYLNSGKTIAVDVGFIASIIDLLEQHDHAMDGARATEYANELSCVVFAQFGDVVSTDEARDTIAALEICDAMFQWMIAHGLATIDTNYTAADVVTILDDLLITVKPLPSDGLDDCFRHHIVTTIGWPAFSTRPGREMQMYEEGFKAGYHRCQSDNAEEFGEGEDWFTERTQRVVAKLRESLKAGQVDPLAIDNAVDLLIDQSKALALANPTPAPRAEP